MNSEINNMDDLFDDTLSRSLRQLGFVFPRTAADFRRIEDQVKANKVIQPVRLKDPYSFLGNRNYKTTNSQVTEEGEKAYSQNFAQAARDGKVISDDIKRKMAEDKLKATQKKKGH